jgi:hypothetical protein
MVYPLKKDFLTISAGSVALGSSATYNITRQPRRLESLLVRFTASTDGSAATSSKITARFGILALVKKITLHVNDVLGSRDAVSLAGYNLLSFLANVGVGPDRNTIQAMPAGLVVSTDYTFTLRIPIRHPQVAEPFGNFLSLPLADGRLKEDAYLRIDFASSSELLSAGSITGVAATVQAIFREMPDRNAAGQMTPYIPSELSAVTFSSATAARAVYEFPTSGTLTGFNLQAYNSSTFAAANVLSSGGRYQLRYGTDVRLETDDGFQLATNDQSRSAVFPAVLSGATTLPTMQPRQEAFFDFFTEESGQDAFSVNSTLNLASEILAGDKVRLQFNDLASASNSVDITSHRFLPTSVEQLTALSSMV